MKQIIISTTQESETVYLTVTSKPDENGASRTLFHTGIPDASGSTQQVIGLQEGETLTIA